MEAKEYAFDLTRIFLGEMPPLFWLEILLRTTVIYLYALFVIRLLGKRGLGQLAPFDFVIIIALGSAVGDPMFYPDVPILHSMIVLTLIVIFTRGIERLTERSSKVKDFVDSTTTRLVIDGRVDCAGIKGEAMAPSELFEALRGVGVEQLGQVERAYLEPSGKVTTFMFAPERVRPGLALLPPCEENWPALRDEGDVVEEARDYAAGIAEKCST